MCVCVCVCVYTYAVVRVATHHCSTHHHRPLLQKLATRRSFHVMEVSSHAHRNSHLDKGTIYFWTATING